MASYQQPSAFPAEPIRPIRITTVPCLLCGELQWRDGVSQKLILGAHIEPTLGLLPTSRIPENEARWQVDIPPVWPDHCWYHSDCVSLFQELLQQFGLTVDPEIVKILWDSTIAPFNHCERISIAGHTTSVAFEGLCCLIRWYPDYISTSLDDTQEGENSQTSVARYAKNIFALSRLPAELLEQVAIQVDLELTGSLVLLGQTIRLYRHIRELQAGRLPG
ncbi:hypothetical protein PENSUB_9261 [Penicillium subrubescens]|uniref:Uncharacterized protein n=1 Tax=Penicillium subrubescens TaxID=1316194 RepID=A0A1Q5TD66_9EURO|nr:hypothetical protein PENSUB_9261 [Penicillium subrubescens]